MARRSGWTIDTLREHFLALIAEKDKRDQQRYEAQTDAINAALLAAEKAVTKAEAANQRRFEGVNEFRQTLSDQAATFLSRAEFEAQRRADDTQRKADDLRMRDLAARVDKTEGKSAGLNAGWGYLIGAIGLFAAIVAVVVALQ